MTVSARRHDHANLGGSNRLLTMREAAPLLGTTPDSLRRHYARWGIPSVKMGPGQNARVKFRERDLHAWIEHRLRDAG